MKTDRDPVNKLVVFFSILQVCCRGMSKTRKATEKSFRRIDSKKKVNLLYKINKIRNHSKKFHWMLATRKLFSALNSVNGSHARQSLPLESLIKNKLINERNKKSCSHTVCVWRWKIESKAFSPLGVGVGVRCFKEAREKLLLPLCIVLACYL